MSATVDHTRTDTTIKLDDSRSELRNLFGETHDDSRYGAIGSSISQNNFFPRSKTMQFLMSPRGLAVGAAVAGSLLILRPTLATRLMRLVPVTSLARQLALRFFNQRGI